MLKRRISKRLNEDFSYPSLRWEVDDLPGNPNNSFAEAGISGHSYNFDVWDITSRGNYAEPRIGVGIGMDNMDADITQNLAGTIEDGKRVCESVWEAVCAVSEYADMDEHILGRIFARCCGM